MSKHALLSASSSGRWLACPPSVRLTETYPDSESSYAAEGTDAHTLCEYKVRCSLGENLSEIVDIRETLGYYSLEMEEYADEYAAYVTELLETARHTCRDPLLLLEQRVDYSKYVPEGFGTADTILITDGVLHLVDFKYGKGIPVYAEENPQLKLYSLGAIEMLGCLYDVSLIRMTVFQPRLSNISTWEITAECLYEWVEDELKPKAKQAYEGEGEYKAGSHCRFCRAKAECRTRAEANLRLAAYEFADSALLENDEISDILSKADELISWVSDIKEYALSEALKGTKFDGWKVVSGRSNRKYTDEDTVAKKITEEGYDPYEHKVIGVSAMEKLIGKKRFMELLENLIEKPIGKATLVPESDKRREINTASDDFADEN